MTTSYKKPPIVEAVIEFRLRAELGRPDLEKIRDKLNQYYPIVTEEKQLLFRIGQNETESSVSGSFNGFKLNSTDFTDAVVVRSNSLAVARLAPYQSWETFKERAAQCWSVWQKLNGNQRLTRIGVRYINRLDIPSKAGDKVHEDEYLQNSLRVPHELLPTFNSYAMQLTTSIGEDNCVLILNSGSTVSPLFDHFALLLDIDIVCETNIPAREDELWALVEKMRGHKNRIFEGLITDKSRELFSK